MECLGICYDSIDVVLCDMDSNFGLKQEEVSYVCYDVMCNLYELGVVLVVGHTSFTSSCRTYSSCLVMCHVSYILLCSVCAVQFCQYKIAAKRSAQLCHPTKVQYTHTHTNTHTNSHTYTHTHTHTHTVCMCVKNLVS